MSLNTQDLAKQDEYLKMNIANMVNAAKFKGQVKFTNFLDERQQAITQQQLNKLQYHHYSFYGGTSNCDRVMLGIFPEDIPIDTSDFPIHIIEASFSNRTPLSHRDFLGSLMGLQLERDCIGDILVENEKAILFVTDKVSDFILFHLSKIGKASVQLKLVDECSIEKQNKFEEITGTVASLRLDCIVALLIGKSRTIAVETILSQRVKVNYFDVDELSYSVKPNDVITIRGKGKFILSEEIRQTKKGRFYILAKKFI